MNAEKVKQLKNIVEVDAYNYTYTTQNYLIKLQFPTSGSKVRTYTPRNTYNSTSVTLSYPWGVSVSFNLGGKVDVMWLLAQGELAIIILGSCILLLLVLPIIK